VVAEPVPRVLASRRADVDHLRTAAGGTARRLPTALSVLDVLGAILWLIGFTFEAVGDLQLWRFKSDPANKGKVMDRGVWRYTRHPNYFGDAAQWWGYYLIAAAAGAGGPSSAHPDDALPAARLGRYAAREDTRERPGYKEYIERTSAFIPWFPRGR